MSGFGAGCRGGQDRGQAGSSRHDSKLIQNMRHCMTAGVCDVRDAGRFISASIIQLAVDGSCNIGALVGTACGSLAARHAVNRLVRLVQSASAGSFLHL